MTRDYTRYASWLAPLLVTSVVVIYNLMYAVEAVTKIETRLEQQLERIREIEQKQRDAARLDHVHYTEIKIKLDHISDLCCSELDDK